MNFLCENCKQKYHVADEKLRGRAVTRFKCKKCENIIEVRGDGPADEGADEGGSSSLLTSLPPGASSPPPGISSGGTGSRAPLRPPASAPTAAPTPVISTGAPRPGAGPAAAPAPRPLTSPTTPRPAASPTAASAPRPVGTAPSAPKPALASPSPSATNTASRTPLSTIGSATGTRPTPQTTAPRAATTATRPTAPASTPASAARSPATAPSAPRSGNTALAPSPAAPTTASTSALLNPSETGWYAGIRDVPVGPLTRVELADKIESGDITVETLVWREGLDDWRPLQEIKELESVLRESSKRLSASMLHGTAKRPATNVVPISRANPNKNDDPPEESTRLTSLSDLIATAEGPALKRPAPTAPVAASESPARAPVTTAATAVPEPAKVPEPATAPEPAAAMVAMVPPPAVSEPSALEDAFFSGKKLTPAVSSLPPVAAPPPATPVASAMVSTPLPVPPPSALSTPFAMDPPARVEQKKGMSTGIIVLIGGLVFAAAGGGLLAGTRINTQAPVTPPVVTAPPVVTPPPVTPPPVPTPAVVAPPTPEVVPAQTAPATPEVAPTTHTGAHHGTTAPPSTGRSTATATAPTPAGPTAAQIAEMQRQLGNATGVTGGGPVITANTARTTTSSSEPVQGPTGGARASQVLATFNRTNVVGSCWQQQITRNPAHPPERLQVTLSVGTTGRASGVNVGGASDAALARCIESRARAQNYGPGGQIDAQASFNLAIGG